MTNALLGPVCDTCRKKSRKCDRARPSCTRCIVKGLVCEGYPTTFKIYDHTTRQKLPSNIERTPKRHRKVQTSTQIESKKPRALVDMSESPEDDEQNTSFVLLDRPSPDELGWKPSLLGESQIANVLVQEEVRNLLTYCELLSLIKV